MRYMVPSERVSGDNKCFPAKGPFLIHIIERDRIYQVLLSRSINEYQTELLRAYQRDASGSQAKLLLPNAGHTVDSLYEENVVFGLVPRSSAFKKVEGLSPPSGLIR